jgi:hypothetical protein
MTSSNGGFVHDIGVGLISVGLISVGLMAPRSASSAMDGSGGASVSLPLRSECTCWPRSWMARRSRYAWTPVMRS